MGPLGSSSFNLPHVERALSEMEVGIGNTALASSVSGDAARRIAARAPGRPLPSMLSSTSTAPALGRPPISPTTIASSPSPTGGQTQHEVLQNFFQSLLTSKDRAGATAAGAKRSAITKTNGSTEGVDNGA